MFDRIIHNISRGCHFGGMLSLLCLISFFNYAGELPERGELFARTPLGTHRIHATTQADVTGKGKVDLLICQPYPENNKYQDVKWLKEIPTNLKAVY